MKQIIILRGVSGSGKTSVARAMCAGRDGWRYIEADAYFTDMDGNYNFDASKLGEAHHACRSYFRTLLNDPKVEGIVVANTNTSEKEWEYYEKKAKESGAEVFHLIVENRHGNKDVHGVPDEVRAAQGRRILNDIKLF